MISSLQNDDEVTIEGSTFRAQNNSAEHALQRISSWARQYFRFELRPGDHWSGDGPGNGDVERTELALIGANAAFDSEIWQYWDFKLAEFDSGADWFEIGQWHGADNSQGRSPWFAVQWMAGGGLEVLRRYHSAADDESPPEEGLLFQDASVAAGVRHRLVVHLKAADAGIAEVWLDGAKIINYAGNLGYLDNENAGYFKFGAYRAADAATALITYAMGPVGGEDLSAMIGPADPIPF